MNDENDFMQWYRFVSKSDKVNERWWLCTEYGWIDFSIKNGFCNSHVLSHKATLKELFERFGEKLNQ